MTAAAASRPVQRWCRRTPTRGRRRRPSACRRTTATTWARSSVRSSPNPNPDPDPQPSLKRSSGALRLLVWHAHESSRWRALLRICGIVLQDAIQQDLPEFELAHDCDCMYGRELLVWRQRQQAVSSVPCGCAMRDTATALGQGCTLTWATLVWFPTGLPQRLLPGSTFHGGISGAHTWDEQTKTDPQSQAAVRVGLRKTR